jgi:hypothetical protein
MRLAGRGIRAKNILIWKTPLEFAHSRQRRGRLENWDREWIRYHRLYFSAVDDWRAVRYQEVANASNGAVLEKACRFLEIPYFPGKEEYWKKTHHVLFGNRSAQFHLYSPTKAKDYLAGVSDEEMMAYYRSIYYRQAEDLALQNTVDKAMSNSKEFDRILGVLEAHDVSNEAVKESDVRAAKLSWPSLVYRRCKYRVRAEFGKLRYARNRQKH